MSPRERQLNPGVTPLAELIRPLFHVRVLGALDSEGQDMLSGHFEAAAEFIQEGRKAGGVLVGESRQGQRRAIFRGA